MSTAAYLNGGVAPAAPPQRVSAGRLIGASARALGGRVAGRARGVTGDLFDVAGLGAFTYGAFQLPGAWALTGWAVAGLALLITGAKLNP